MVIHPNATKTTKIVSMNITSIFTSMNLAFDLINDWLVKVIRSYTVLAELIFIVIILELFYSTFSKTCTPVYTELEYTLNIYLTFILHMHRYIAYIHTYAKP